MEYRNESLNEDSNYDDDYTNKLEQSFLVQEVTTISNSISNAINNNILNELIQGIRFLQAFVTNNNVNYDLLISINELWENLFRILFESEIQELIDAILSTLIDVLNVHSQFREILIQKSVHYFLLDKIRFNSANHVLIDLFGLCVDWDSDIVQDFLAIYYNTELPIEFFSNASLQYANYIKLHKIDPCQCLDMIDFGFEKDVFGDFLVALNILFESSTNAVAATHNATLHLLQKINQISIPSELSIASKIAASAFGFTYAAPNLKPFFESDYILSLCNTDENFFPLLCLIYSDPDIFHKIHGTDLENFLFLKIEEGKHNEREQASAAVATALRLFESDELVEFLTSQLFEDLSSSIEGDEEIACKILLGLRSMLTEHPECTEYLMPIVEILEEIEEEDGVGPSAYLLLNMILQNDD